MSEWLSVPDAAARAEITRGRIYQLINAGRFRLKREGRRIYLSASDLERYKVFRAQWMRLHKTLKPINGAGGYNRVSNRRPAEVPAGHP